ncbi:MAG: AAA family ATPase, partial [Candidatus Bipolaricaulota bacterium]
MIERLQISDFQCHERLRVDFDPRITTVIGDSDVGKSAVLRALRWLVLNKPRGDGFVRFDAKRTTVLLEADGLRVGRRKGVGENAYRVDGEVYKSFGAEVPQAVGRLLNLGDENFGMQHDPPFWFCLTPGELAKRLNAIVDLSAIDEVTGRVAARLRRAKAEREVVEARLAEARTEAESLDHVPEVAEDLERVEGLAGESVRRAAQAVRAGALVDEGRNMGARAGRLRTAALEGLGVVSSGSAALRASERSESLAACVTEVKRAAKSAGRKVPDLSGLDRLVGEAKVARSRTVELGRLIGEVVRVHREFGRSRTEAARARTRLNKETGGRCPLCGG